MLPQNLKLTNRRNFIDTCRWRDKLSRMSKKSGRYIVGIFNYCDSWCERCAFTDRCRNFHMQRAIERQIEREERRQAAGETPPPTPWDEYEKAAEKIEPWLEQERRAFALKEAKKERDIRKSPLTRRAKKYSDATYEWVKSHDGKIDESNAAATDAFSVVAWYMFLIQVKLMRAQHIDSAADDFEDFDPKDPDDAELAEAIDESQRDDNNGSAKVALIGIDRSIAAWAVLRANGYKEAEDFIRQLDQLRSVAEMVFPNARDFIRPGLDWPEEMLH